MAVEYTDSEVQKYIDAITSFGQEGRLKFNKILWDYYVQSNPINQHLTIETGVKCNTPIPLGDRGRRFDFMQNASTKASQCDRTEYSIDFELSTKIWNPIPFENSPSVCFKDVSCLMKSFFESEKCSEADPRGTLYARFTAELIMEAMKDSHWAKAFFSYAASGNTALDGFDGLFTQWLAEAPVGNTDQRVVIAENSGASYVAQELADDTALNTFLAMNERIEQNRGMRNKNIPIRTTPSLAFNYLKSLREKQITCCERDTTTSIYTMDKLNIFGRPIITVHEWEDVMEFPAFAADFDNGTVVDNPHRAVAYDKDNVKIGTCNATELTKLDIIYDPVGKKTYFDAEYDMDAKNLLDNQFVIAV